jgi:hydroxypyruvate isomerase
MLFTEVDFLNRFELAVKAGFKAVEYMFPYAYPSEQLSQKLKENDLHQVLFNLPAGRWEDGERGIAVLPDRISEFQEGVGQAVEYALHLGCPQVNCLLGLTPALSAETIQETVIKNLRFAAEKLAEKKIRLLIEALNTKDIPGFYLTSTAQALTLLQQVNHPNLFIQYDVYHMQIMEGDLTETIGHHLDQIAHIQIADNPGRHEPGTGEINFFNLFSFIDRAGYNGYVGCEYKPLKTTQAGLSWIGPFLNKEELS